MVLAPLPKQVDVYGEAAQQAPQQRVYCLFFFFQIIIHNYERSIYTKYEALFSALS